MHQCIRQEGVKPLFLMFGEQARVRCEVILGIALQEQTPSDYSFRRYPRLSHANDAAPEARSCAQRP